MKKEDIEITGPFSAGDNGEVIYIANYHPAKISESGSTKGEALKQVVQSFNILLCYLTGVSYNSTL